MLDFEMVIALGAELCVYGSSDWEERITLLGLNERLGVARRISAGHPRFGVTVTAIEQSYARASIDDLGESLIEEFELIQSFAGDNELAHDSDYLALLAGMTGFMERFGRPERNDSRVVLRALEINERPLRDAGGVALVLMGCWFADYRGFRAALERAVGERLGLDLGSELWHGTRPRGTLESSEN